MLRKLIFNQIFKTLLGSMKGGKKWLIALAVVVVVIVQALGVDLGSSFDAFAEDVVNQFCTN